MQFLCEFFKKLVNFLKCMGGSLIQHISKGFYHYDFQINLENENIDGGCGECNFPMTILKEN